MKVNLTRSQQNQLDNAKKINPVRKWMEFSKTHNFEVGDVLIRLNLRGDKWEPQPISYDNKMPQRFVYIHQDEYGIGWIKTLRVSDGELGSELICLTDVVSDEVKFEVDPEYAEHALLDADFDIKKLHKRSLEARKLVSKANKKIGTKFKTLSEANLFFSTMQVGDKFWISQDYTGRWIEECTLTKIVKQDMTTRTNKAKWPWRSINDNQPELINETKCYEISYKIEGFSYGGDEFLVIGFVKGRNRILYKQEPATEDKGS